MRWATLHTPQGGNAGHESNKKIDPLVAQHVRDADSLITKPEAEKGANSGP